MHEIRMNVNQPSSFKLVLSIVNDLMMKPDIFIF